MLKKNKSVSFEERLNSAHATADAAVSVVETIAFDLEVAVADKQALIEDIDNETERLYAVIGNLLELRDEAEEAADANTIKAAQIRALISA